MNRKDHPYTDWARYYDALHKFKDYRGEATRLAEVIRRFHPEARTLLDVACGTGQHLRHLTEEFKVEGLDANATFLDVARDRLPEIPWHQGSMENFRLGKRFDVVTCLFSSIGFTRTKEALQEAVETFAKHLEPGGLLVIEPWFSAENFWTGRVGAHFVDERDLKIAWFYTTAVEDDLSVLSNEIMVGTPHGIDHIQEKHVLGLFSAADYLDAITTAGLKPLLSLGFEPYWMRGLHVARQKG
jgi:ubiquinone/menaquinone biosynthesis C-methylase UbiE